MQQQSQPCSPGIPFRPRVPQQQQSFVSKSPSAPRRFTQPYQVAYFFRTSYDAHPARRLPTGCHVCGQFGCHSDFYFAGPPQPEQQPMSGIPYIDAHASLPPPPEFAEPLITEQTAYQQPAHSNIVRGPRPVQAPIARPASR